MRRNIFTLLAIVSFSTMGFGQGSIWSLERCILYSQQNNLNVQQSAIAVSQAELVMDNTKRQYYPTLNGSFSLGGNFGRSIDPTTNDFVTRAIVTNGITVSGGILLYDFGRKPKQLQQNKYDIEAAKLDVESTKNNIGLQVAQAYLQILLAEEQLANSEVNLKQLQDQLEQTNKLIRAGILKLRLPPANKWSFQIKIPLIFLTSP
jgi:outer membrane protein